MFMLPPCGMGGESDSTGPCTGSYSPGDAGRGLFSGIDIHGIVLAILGAGLLIVGLLFTIWVVRKVARFFKGYEAGETSGAVALSAYDQGVKHRDEMAADGFDWDEYNRWEWSVEGDNDGLTELDCEDDSPEDDDEPMTKQLGYGA